MKLYVGNLPWSITDADLNKLFSEVGEVMQVPQSLPIEILVDLKASGLLK